MGPPETSHVQPSQSARLNPPYCFHCGTVILCLQTVVIFRSPQVAHGQNHGSGSINQWQEAGGDMKRRNLRRILAVIDDLSVEESQILANLAESFAFARAKKPKLKLARGSGVAAVITIPSIGAATQLQDCMPLSSSRILVSANNLD